MQKAILFIIQRYKCKDMGHRLKVFMRDFPGGTVVNMPPSNGGEGSIPGRGPKTL